MSAVPRVMAQKSTVEIRGKLAEGRIISQDLPIPHDPGAVDFQLINAAIQSLRSIGGMMGEGEDPDTVVFYPVLMFTGGISFKVRRVSLATGSLSIQ